MDTEAQAFIHNRVQDCLSNLSPCSLLAKQNHIAAKAEQIFTKMLHEPQQEIAEDYFRALNDLYWDEHFFFWVLGLISGIRYPNGLPSNAPFSLIEYQTHIHTDHFCTIDRQLKILDGQYRPLFPGSLSAPFSAARNACLLSIQSSWQHCFQDGIHWIQSLLDEAKITL